ncbi:MAG: hypothetical protein ABI919_06890 [Ramlibacter sp.]
MRKHTDERMALVLARSCQALAVLLPLATAAYLANAWPLTLVTGLAGMAPAATLDGVAGWRLLGAAALGMLPALCMALALRDAGHCFAQFARGAHFTVAAVQALRRFARGVLIAAVAGALVPTAMVLLLTTGGPQPAVLAVSFGSQHVFMLLFASVLWQIASVLARAVALAEENAQFV